MFDIYYCPGYDSTG